MKERKRSLEMRVLVIVCLFVVAIGGSAVLGLAAKWDQVAYASFSSPEQVWNRTNRSQDSRVPEVARSVQPATSASAASLVLDKQVRKADERVTNRVAKAQEGEVSIAAAAKTVYLTFDDGPSANTADVLDILAKEKVKGTFFVLGQQVEQHGKLVKRIVDEGHALGNHSYNHNYKELYSSFSTFWSQVRKTGAAIEKVAGYEPALVRAPGGTYLNFNKQYFDLMEQAGYKVFDWNVDSGDSKRVGVPKKEIVRAVKEGVLGNRVIVLMHDSNGHEETVKALPEIIAYYKAKGYKFQVLGEDTEPMQFRLASKERWNRSAVSKTWITANIASVQVGGDTVNKPDNTDKPDKPNKPNPSVDKPVVKPKPMEFTIMTNIGEFTFEPEQYATDKATTYVQLRSFVEQLGGSISYEAETLQYGLQFNGANWLIDSKTGQLSRIREDGVVEQLAWKALMQHHTFLVPLRSLLEDSGAQLLSYELKPVGTAASSVKLDQAPETETDSITDSSLDSNADSSSVQSEGPVGH